MRSDRSCCTDNWRLGGKFDGIVTRSVSIPVVGQTGTGNLGAPSRIILSMFGDSAQRSDDAAGVLSKSQFNVRWRRGRDSTPPYPNSQRAGQIVAPERSRIGSLLISPVLLGFVTTL